MQPMTRTNTIKEFISDHKKLIIIITTLLVIGLLAIIIATSIRNSAPKQTVGKNPIINSYQEKLPALADAVKKNGEDAKARQEYAVALYATGDTAKAREQYEAQLRLSPQDATLRNNLGNAYRDLGDYEKAISSYQKSIELNPKQNNAYVNLANLYLYTLDKKDLAIKIYQDALKVTPDNQDLMVLLGIAQEQSGKKAEALETFKTVLAKNAQNQGAIAGVKRVQ